MSHWAHNSSSLGYRLLALKYSMRKFLFSPRLSGWSPLLPPCLQCVSGHPPCTEWVAPVTLHFQFIDEAMEADCDLTSRQLHSMVVKEYPDLSVSVSTIQRARRALGWNSKRARYCAMISDINKEKRMTWCLDHVAEGDLELSDVIWTDESSIQLESHCKTVYQKWGQPIQLVSLLFWEVEYDRPSLKKAKKQGEMPLPSLGPIPSLNEWDGTEAG